MKTVQLAMLLLILMLCACAQTSKAVNVNQAVSHAEQSQVGHFSNIRAGFAENSAADSIIIIKNDTIFQMKYYGITKSIIDTLFIVERDTISLTKIDTIYISKTEITEKKTSLLDSIFERIKWIILALVCIILSAILAKILSSRRFI